MAEGLLVGCTEDELVIFRNAALAALKPGGNRSGFQLGELSVQIDVSGFTPKELLREANYALRRINPAQYGPNVVRVIGGFHSSTQGLYGD